VVDRNFETARGADGQHMADSICQGDNFAIVANDPFGGEQYFIILCDKPLFTCREDFQDGWGNDWEARYLLFRNYWYHEKRKNSGIFVLLDTSPFALCYFHLVLCAKFVVPLATHKCKGSLPTYTLECKVEETILQGLTEK
jgi:hypothetical protein